MISNNPILDIKTNIKGVVNDMKNIYFMQPIYESITNSLEANATKIEIEFFDDNELIGEPVINSFKIEDNGDGFNEKNINSFNTYRSNYKEKNGCKGIGRFTWLKVYEDIQIKSILKNKKVDIHFSLNTKNNILSEEDMQNENYNKTTIIFKSVNDKYVKKREVINLNEIIKSIKENLFVKLFLLKTEGRTFCIKLKYKNNIKSLSENDLEECQKKEFIINDYNNEQHNFILYYVFLKDSFKNNQFCYCANGRNVRSFNIGIEEKRR